MYHSGQVMPSDDFILSDNQALVATANSEDVINLGSAPGAVPYQTNAIARFLNGGGALPITIQITESFATATSYKFQFVTSAAENLGTPTVIWDSGAIAIATLVAGYRLPIRYLPPFTPLQYLGMIYTEAGSTATAGSVFAAIGLARQTNNHPPS